MFLLSAFPNLGKQSAEHASVSGREHGIVIQPTHDENGREVDEGRLDVKYISSCLQPSLKVMTRCAETFIRYDDMISEYQQLYAPGSTHLIRLFARCSINCCLCRMLAICRVM